MATTQFAEIFGGTVSIVRDDDFDGLDPISVLNVRKDAHRVTVYLNDDEIRSIINALRRALAN